MPQQAARSLRCFFVPLCLAFYRKHGRIRKLSSYRGTLHAVSETLGHVKCHCDSTIVLALIDVVYCYGRKTEHFSELLGKPTFKEETDVFVDAVEAECDFWLATLVWAGERPAIPHVNRSEDIFSSILDSVRNGAFAKGDGPTSLKHWLDSCQRCHSTPAYDTAYSGSWNEPSGWHTIVGQMQEPSGHQLTTYPASDKDGIIHSDVASSGWKPNAAVQPNHGWLPEDADFTVIDNMIHPAVVDVTCISATSDATEFQGFISASLADASATQPAAWPDIPGTRQTAVPSPHEVGSRGAH
ncbi:hypothetical protein MTO96_039469, partial [Rhipicephalus appendiculatus]